MLRGRTVEIKMSSSTAWTGNMATLPFVSQPANCSTLLWPQLQRSCPLSPGCSVDRQCPRVSGTQ